MDAFFPLVRIGDSTNFGNGNLTDLTVYGDVDFKNDLAVDGNSTFTGQVIASSSSSGDYVRMYGGSGTAQWDIYGNGENLRFSENSGGGGHVDIDTNLVVDGSVTIGSSTATLNLTGSNTGASLINFADSDDGNVGRIYYDHTDNFMQFKTNDSEKMRIDSSGNVGIGTASPATKLHLNNSATLTATYQKFTNGTATAGTTLGIDADGDFIINNEEAKEIKLYTDDTQRLTIQSGGNVGIGTTSPSHKLDVTGTIRSNATEGKLILNSTATDGNEYQFISIDTGNLGIYDGTAYSYGS